MKGRKIVFLIILLIIIIRNSAFAGTKATNTLHTVCGTVEDLLGENPPAKNLHIIAYIVARPDDKIYYNIAGEKDKIKYKTQRNQAWWYIQCADFSVQWSDGEWLHLDFVYDLSSNEKQTYEIQINAAFEPQLAGDFSLPVQLYSFNALVKNNKVVLKWETSSEVDNLGFYIYRGENLDGPFQRIPEFIEGIGNSALGRAYEYIDKKVEPNKTYFYYLEDIDIAGSKTKSDTIKVTVSVGFVKKVVAKEKFVLLQNYPNPFNPETWIPYKLATEASVNIEIYNLQGQFVRWLDIGKQEAGSYITKDKAAYWDGKNEAGEPVASGVYFYEFNAGAFKSIKRMLLLK